MQIDPEQYYASRMVELKRLGGGEAQAICPFHADTKPSLALNFTTGLWYCFGACRQGGNIVQFEAKLKNTDTKTAWKNLCQEFNIENGKDYLDEKIVDECHQKLLSSTSALEKLERERGIKLETIRKYRLGLDTDSSRLTIPVYKHGYCINIRKYKSHATDMKVIGIKGFNSPALFPFENIKGDPIYLMEGEMDCLLANQLGLNAITVTGGAGTFPIEWKDYFVNKHIIICYDIDEAGRNGAAKVIELLKNVATIKNIELPIQTPANGDFTDYIVTHGFTINDFNDLVEKTKDIEKAVVKDPVAIKTNLQDASNAIYYNKYIELPITVSGKDAEGFNVPRSFKVKCKPSKEGLKCSLCNMKICGGERIFEIKNDDPIILEMVDINQFQLIGVLRDRAKVNCKFNDIEILDKQSIEEIIAIPEISYKYDMKDVEYINRKLYYGGHGLRSNKSYIVKGYNYTNPKNQYATVLIQKALATQGELDRTKITKEMKDKMVIFQCPATVPDIKNKLEDIYQDFSYNLEPPIFERNDMRFAIDLCFHSAIEFNFCGKYVSKGWIDALVIGDTKCGKSKSVEGMIRHYRAGEVVGGDNVSKVGLLGGVQQIGKGWNITWGKLVLNNGRLIAIDEFSSISVQDIGELSGVRTSGIAEITKIRSAKTVARTRFLCFSNSRSGRKLCTYSKGISAVKELIGRAEDISRFDYALTVADDEVDQMKINDYMQAELEHRYNSDTCHNLVMWAWTRNANDIIWIEDTEKLILEYSLLLNEEYDSSIPLVTPAEQRIKLARMAIALAIRLYSTDDGERVLVTKAHAEHCYNYLRQIYNKPSMGYDLYSSINNRTSKFIKDGYSRLIAEFKGLTEWKQLGNMLLEYDVIRTGELELQMKYEKAETRAFFNWASKNFLMHSIHVGAASGYVKHPLFIKMLKEITKEGV